MDVLTQCARPFIMSDNESTACHEVNGSVPRVPQRYWPGPSGTGV